MKPAFSFALRVARLSVCFVVFTVPCFAQDTSVRVTGRVFQPEGAAFPGVTVSATSDDRRHTVVTGGDGRFVLTDLPPGVYTLAAEIPGFRTQRTRIELHASETLAVDFALRLSRCIADSIAIAEHVAIAEARTMRLSDMLAYLVVQRRHDAFPSDSDCGVRYTATLLRALKSPTYTGTAAGTIDLVFDNYAGVQPGGEYVAWLAWRPDRNAFAITAEAEFVWPVKQGRVEYYGVETSPDNRATWGTLQKSVDDLFGMLRVRWQNAPAR